MTAWPYTPYCGAAARPADLAGRWNLDPALLAALAAVAIALWARSARHGGRRGLALAAMAVLVLIFVSPLCALSSALFSARTVHHVLLVAVAAPLIAWSLRVGGRAPLASATALHAAAFWTWHAPALYGSALASDGAYWLMQPTLAGSALWFWTAVRAASAPAAVAALLAATVQMGLLGALLTFSERALYAPHATTTATWGLTPLQDQQIGGLIMWAPAAGLYLLAAVLLLGRWLGLGPARAAT